MTLRSFVAIVLSLLILCVTAIASPGDPDTTFGFFGVKNDHVFNKEMHPVVIAQQADGKLLVAGSMEGEGFPFTLLLLRRYNTDGTVDTGFGLSGFAVAGRDDYIYGHANDIAIQSDGKILVSAGFYSFGSTDTRPAVYRFLPNGYPDTAFGTPDPTFGYQGRASFPSSIKDPAFLVAEKGGKIVTTIRINGSTRDLVRLTANGTFDTTFGFAGYVEPNIGFQGFALNKKGTKIIVHGSVGAYPGVPTLQYFNIDGTPDIAHGTNGIASLSNTPGCNYVIDAVKRIDVQVDGKIIIGAMCGSPYAGPYNSISRLLTNDSLDMGFGTSGYAYQTAFEETDPIAVPRVRVAKTSERITAGGHPPPNSIRRYSTSGIFQVGFNVTFVLDFVVQSSDEKLVTLHANSGDIKLRRFMP